MRPFAKEVDDMSAERQFFRYLRSTPERADDLYWCTREGSRFFPTTPRCPYCDADTRRAYRNTRQLSAPPEDLDQWWTDYTVVAYMCDGCGWWYVVDEDDHHDMDSDGSPWRSTSYHRAVLEVHDLTSPTVPLDALEQELKRRRDGIHHLHPRAMERLVAGVMREHYPGCKVELCGRSGDGGIDLFIVLADKIIGVQVKRREAPSRVESVAAVREFFGAGVAKRLRNLIFVSTAERYTSSQSGAEAFARQVVDDRIIDFFELINRNRFLSMLDVVVHEPEKDPWRVHVW